MAGRLRVRASHKPVMIVRRDAIRDRKLVYVICVPKSRKYAEGRSRIVYIGQTQKGVGRVAGSVADKAKNLLRFRGIRSLEAYTVTATRRPGLDTWRVLEKDLLVTFKQMYGSVPLGNKSGKNFRRHHRSGVFNRNRLESVLEGFQS